MKTKVYITLGIIMNLILLGAPLLFTGWHIFFAYLGSLSYLILSVIICASNDLYSVTFWFSPFKKIYHSDYGTLYTEVFQPLGQVKQIAIYEQKWLCRKLICSLHYNDNIEFFKKDIKRELDKVYKERLKNDNSNFENWDGYLDTQSKRDDKLTKIGI